MIGLTILVLVAWLYLAHRGLQSIAPNREYKSGTRSCLWRWTKVESDYIVRLHIFKTPWCALCLHWLKKPDAEPWLHDHPVSFLSIILRGGYTELRKTGDGKPHHKVNRRFNFVRADRQDRHRIILVRRNTLTLCFMGPKAREWGFHVWTEMCPAHTATPGWIMWKDYYARLKAGEDMRQLGAALSITMGAADAADSMCQRWQQTYTGTSYDEDTRELDTGEPAPFVAEEHTK